MMKRICQQVVRCAIVLAGAVAILAPAPAQAQITRVGSSSEHRQSIGVTLGGFYVKPEDSRCGDTSLECDDVLVADLSSLAFNVKDFNGATITGEWLVGVSDFLEVGVSAGLYQKTVPSVYRNFTDVDNSEIEQDLKLRVVPLTATIRFLPLGHATAEPYVGAGIGAFNWRYSETGEFVDFSDSSIFRANYVAKGTAVGPVIVAGLRIPFAEVFDLGGEVRYQRAKGNIDTVETGLLGSKIDLGGWNAAATFHIRF
jgi:outer membrane protein W